MLFVNVDTALSCSKQHLFLCNYQSWSEMSRHGVTSDHYCEISDFTVEQKPFSMCRSLFYKCILKCSAESVVVFCHLRCFCVFPKLLVQSVTGLSLN